MERLSIDNEVRAVKAIFDGHIREEDFKEFAAEILDKIRESKVEKLLCDTSGLKVMSPKVQEWINETWFPNANKLGISHIAFVVPDNIFGKVSMEQTNKDKQKIGAIDINYFNSISSAREWIKSIN